VWAPPHLLLRIEAAERFPFVKFMVWAAGHPGKWDGRSVSQGKVFAMSEDRQGGVRAPLFKVVASMAWACW
jgi:hypothetical protein